VSVTPILLAPGASGGVERLHPHADGLRRRGFEVELVALPRGPAERAVAPYRAALGNHELGSTVIGGHSFGGRVASLIAAETPPAALVLICYPLHAPGRHDAWDARTAHWPSIDCPVLLLSGEADPFARIDLLRRAVERLEHGSLHTWPGLGHGLGPVLDEALDLVAGFVRDPT
jgi:predicted alpha/beta-hydrolase family hydrolase